MQTNFRDVYSTSPQETEHKTMLCKTNATAYEFFYFYFYFAEK